MGNTVEIITGTPVSPFSHILAQYTYVYVNAVISNTFGAQKDYRISPGNELGLLVCSQC